MHRLYPKLVPDCFRLLSLDDDSGMSCRLDSYHMLEAPPYIALSYTWSLSEDENGQTSPPECSITINDQRFPVQQNLYNALQYLAKRIRSRKCLFWVDAICINQEDGEERNAQVRRMKHIYENAHCIWAWLGLPRDEEQTRLAIEMMADMSLYLKNGLEESGDDIGEVMPTITSSHAVFPFEEGSRT